VIPEILDKWFDQRVEFKNTMKKYAKEENKEMMDYYDQRQHVQKIMLNSVYGVLGLSIFRFYDLDNALAVTATGQDVIKTSAKFVNSLYEKEMGAKADYCIYIDTDSVYFSAQPIVKDLPTFEEKTNRAIELAREHEAKLNKFYDIMAKMLFNVDPKKHRFSIKGEVIAETAFWVAKKRYAMKLLYNLETNMYVDNSKKKPKVKGLDVVRSSFPPAFQKFMSEVLWALLSKETKKQMDVRILDFKKYMKTLNWMEVARNTGVKQVSIYDTKYAKIDDFEKGAPAHSKAAVTYNRMLRLLGVDKKYVPIRNGDKIKWTKLKKNPYGIPTLGMKTYDDPPELIELMEKYIDYDALFEDELENKLVDFYEAMKWGRIPTQVNQNAFKFFTFENEK
jgi:DNA polymerase elongation subunit (family B)